MWYQFILQNIHFGLYLFGALVFFAVFWLYRDAWGSKRNGVEVLRSIGLLGIATAFILHAVHVESVFFPVFTYVSRLALIASGIHVTSLVFLIISLFLDKTVSRPGDSRDPVSFMVVFGSVGGLAAYLPAVFAVAVPVLTLIVTILYVRRATIGLERHMMPLSIAFTWMSIAELIGMHRLFEGTSSVRLYALVMPFGPLWMLSHMVMAVGLIVAARWVFGYLFSQFATQLYMIYTMTILVVFMITAVSFSGLLLKNMERDAVTTMTTDAKVVGYVFEAERERLLSDLVALNEISHMSTVLETGNRDALNAAAQSSLMAKRLSGFWIVSKDGSVMARGEDITRSGDSVSSDPLVRRGLSGEQVTAMSVRDGVFAPQLSLQAVIPVKNPRGDVIGALVGTQGLDAAFVDNLNRTTGLQVSIYGGNTVAATTFTSRDQKSRLLGVRETNDAVIDTVLSKKQVFAGSVRLNNTSYISAYIPLLDSDTNAVGMVFIGRPEVTVLQSAGIAIQWTFVLTVVLIVASLVPAYWISRYMVHQL